jgi:UDPglucose 6-dehydrogenase
MSKEAKHGTSGMSVLYIGAGYVGTCSAAASAESGHTTLVYDIDARRTAVLNTGDRGAIENCLFEEGLGEILVRNRGRTAFTSDYRAVERALDSCAAIFLCVPTPEISETGACDLSHFTAAMENLARALRKRNRGRQTQYVVVVNKSTVPIDLEEETRRFLSKAGVRNFGIVSNPEFLVEGKAVPGSLKPDRIIVGARTERDFAVMRKVYQRFVDAPDVDYVEVNPREAAAGKLLANFLLFHRLAACFDVVGRTCEAFPGLQFEHVRRIVATDPRIGGWGLYASLYAGGSCFIKDARSLAHQLKSKDEDAGLVREVTEANGRQLARFLERAEREAGWNWKGRTVALLGAAFKRHTNDIRNSPSLRIVAFLLDRGVKEIRISDPAALPSFRKAFPASRRVRYFENEQEALAGAEAVLIATDWPQYRGLGEILLRLKKRPLLMDGRRMLQHLYPELRKAGFDIIAVGSPFLAAAK